MMRSKPRPWGIKDTADTIIMGALIGILLAALGLGT